MKKVAFITGGSRGIGLGIAKALAASGFDLAINGMRPEEQVKEVMQDIKNFGHDVIYCRGNVASPADQRVMLAAIRNHYQQLNILVNNAGMAPRQRRDILEATEESYDEVMNTNLKGSYFLMQQAANWMIEEKKREPDFFASIINITSMSATVASVNRGEYCISKAGLSMATQLYAVRLGEYNIPVYEVRPGIIYTDMTSTVKEKYDKLIRDGLCIQQRWGQPEDVGKVVASLARGDMMYSTGQVIMVDGGLTIPRL